MFALSGGVSGTLPDPGCGVVVHLGQVCPVLLSLWVLRRELDLVERAGNVPVDFDPANPVTNGTFRLTRLLQDLVVKKSGLNMVMVEGPRRTNVPLKGASGLGLTPADASPS